jgi:hypothetical protein
MVPFFICFFNFTFPANAWETYYEGLGMHSVYSLHDVTYILVIILLI